MYTSINLPRSHPPVLAGKIGLLIVNLGTPDACTPAAVRRYLAEFLSDRRVIELSPWLWQPILHGIILRTRPAKVAKAYAKIWLSNPDESPLRRYTRQQAEQLQQRFQAQYADQVLISWGMRYGSPALGEQLRTLHQQGCERILIVPLYPQYSATTTGSVVDEISRTLKAMRWQPTLRICPPYYDHPAYIEALAASVRQSIAALPEAPQRLLLSFHGLPEANLQAGDPYYCQCHKTARLLTDTLAMENIPVALVFQSRFGPKPWLKPYADQTIIALAQNNIKRIAILMPGFMSDCLETLEEMGVQNQALFRQHGGTDYTCIPCLNASEASINLLYALCHQELQGWLASP